MSLPYSLRSVIYDPQCQLKLHFYQSSREFRAKRGGFRAWDVGSGFRDNGKEHGNDYIITGYILGLCGVI